MESVAQSVVDRLEECGKGRSLLGLEIDRSGHAIPPLLRVVRGIVDRRERSPL